LLVGGSNPIKVSLEGGGTPLETLLHCLAPGGGKACWSSLACCGGHVRDGEAELASDGGKKVKGPELTWLPSTKVLPTMKVDD
jgi:hypothetical protein